MNFEFYKYQGTGNDFVIIDDRKELFPEDNISLIKQVCDRKFGVGADGLMLLKSHGTADFELVFYNPDGSKSFCGNGSRCAVMFARHLGIIYDATLFMATDGLHEAHIHEENVYLKMKDVTEIEFGNLCYYLNTGSPHFVQVVKDLASYNVVEEGRKIRYNERFATTGTNVNFIEIQENKQLFIRTYERGVENETLSCGTGVTASALAASYLGMHSPVQIKTLGGDLQVSFKKTDKTSFTDIFLIGPAEMVFKGHWF